MEWRITGVRRWVPVVLLACFGAGAVLRLVGSSDGDWSVNHVLVLVINLAGAVLAAVMVVTVWIARVRLTDAGVEVRGIRSRFIPYTGITRAYRDRWTSGAVSLMLTGDRTVRLPAPVAGLGTTSPQVDEALEQIRARLPQA